jgi:hypothetical protein
MENPILLNVFNPFLTSRNFRNQMERMVRGSKNKGFVDASFESMMKSVGWQGGQAWCMYFCKLVYMQFFSFDRQFIAKVFNGGTQATPNNIIRLNKQGDSKYVFLQENNPQIGDIFIQVNSDNRSLGHAGIVTEVFDKTNIKTIEGNTSLKGVREGEGVFELRRTLEVGKVSRGSDKIFRGYIRRNFTQDELNKLYFDEEDQTLKMRSTNIPATSLQTLKNLFNF